MKNLFKFVFLLAMFFGNFAFGQEKNKVQEENSQIENKFGGCRTFNISVSIGIFSASTDVKVCCNFLGQCHASKQADNNVITGYSADVTDLIRMSKESRANSITILESKAVKIDDEYFKLEKGTYKIINGDNGNKYIEINILPITDIK